MSVALDYYTSRRRRISGAPPPKPKATRRRIRRLAVVAELPRCGYCGAETNLRSGACHAHRDLLRLDPNLVGVSA